MSETGGRPKEIAPTGYATVSEAAERFGVSGQAIYNRIKAGTIPFERSLKQNGQWIYYLPQEWIEQEMKERASQDQISSEAHADLDGISERLDELSEGQEELQQAVREILAATRDDAPRARPDEPEPTVENATARAGRRPGVSRPGGPRRSGAEHPGRTRPPAIFREPAVVA